MRAVTRQHKGHRLGVGLRSILALLNMGFLLLPSVMTPNPVWGAEKLYVEIGPLELSVPISALEVFANSGKINPDFAFYAHQLNQKQLQDLRKFLVTRIDISPVAVAQALYSPTGEILLQRIGQVIETKANQPGFYALRAALILSAASPEGLTPLNVLKKFPTYGVKFNSQRAFQLIGELSNSIRKTQQALAAVKDESVTEASTGTPVNFSQYPDIRQPGLVKWQKKTITLNDTSRSRTFPADIYLPEESSQRPMPVIVISHGLGEDRTTFAYLAKQLASYGFFVAVPEHPGSNAQQVQALLTGFSHVVAPAREFIDRPLDVQFLLNQLETLFKGQLNLQEVGVLGQSYGGYTSLALAGAQLNFQHLQQDCLHSENSLNVSLLLQCQALTLPPANYKLQDERIKAAIAINPIDSSLFWETGIDNIKIPVAIVSGSADTVAPALSEQIKPFSRLTIPDKYLVLLEGGTHFSTYPEPTEGVPIPAGVIGPNPEIGQAYMKALSVAFFKVYIAHEPAYQPYLSAEYAQFISQYEMPLNLIHSLTPAQLENAGNSQKK